MDFVLANEDLVATEELTADELATSISEKEMIADDSASDPEGVDIGAPQPVTFGAAVAAVDTLPFVTFTYNSSRHETTGF